jgi:hypothetical protein
LNVHIDPDEVQRECTALREIVAEVIRMHPDEDDFIIFGDLNAPPDYFQTFEWLANQFPLIRDSWFTMPRSQRNTDNIVIDGRRTAEYLNQSGVLNLMRQYQLTLDQALVVSDHMPVWGVFSAIESPPTVAHQNTPFAR